MTLGEGKKSLESARVSQAHFSETVIGLKPSWRAHLTGQLANVRGQDHPNLSQGYLIAQVVLIPYGAPGNSRASQG